jgi:hypothetical protein
MKAKILITLLTAVALGLHAKDELKAIPKTVFGVFSYEEAKAQSAKKKDPIVFILVNERSEEPEVEATTKIAYWGLEKDNTMVILRPNTAAEWKRRLPENLIAAMNHKDLGKGYPRLVAMEQTGTVIISAQPATKLIEGGEDFVKAYSKELKELNKNPPKVDVLPAATPATTPGAPAVTPAPGIAPKPPAAAMAGTVSIAGGKVEGWTNNEGRTIQATLVEVSPDKVVFLMPNGAKVDYALSNLNDASKKRVEELKAASVQ